MRAREYVPAAINAVVDAKRPDGGWRGDTTPPAAESPDRRPRRPYVGPIVAGNAVDVTLTQGGSPASRVRADPDDVTRASILYAVVQSQRLDTLDFDPLNLAGSISFEIEVHTRVPPPESPGFGAKVSASEFAAGQSRDIADALLQQFNRDEAILEVEAEYDEGAATAQINNNFRTYVIVVRVPGQVGGVHT